MRNDNTKALRNRLRELDQHVAQVKATLRTIEHSDTDSATITEAAGTLVDQSYSLEAHATEVLAASKVFRNEWDRGAAAAEHIAAAWTR